MSQSQMDSQAEVPPADTSAHQEPRQKAVLRVVRGNPDEAQLAALLAVISARSAAAAHLAARELDALGRSRVRSEWGHPARMRRESFRVGTDQWRKSAWAR